MTDKEIVKALEEVTSNRAYSEDEISTIIVRQDFLKDVLAYINQLEAEVESITMKFNCQQQVYADLSNIIKAQNTEIDGLKTRNINNCRHWQKKYNSLRAEAVKDFAKKLKCGVPQETGVIRCKDVDNLVSEMVGESNDT